MERLPDALKECGRLLFERGLVWGRSGNISARAEADTFLISASGSSLGILRDDDLVKCSIPEDVWDGRHPPSMEAGLHRRIYQLCGEARAIIHSQPFYSTLVACSDLPVPVDLLPETMAYLGKVERVRYSHAGSPELAEATAARATTCQVLLLENHGVVCWADAPDKALLKTETLEFLCRLFVMSRAAGLNLERLGSAAMDDFLQRLRGKSGTV